jgi:hypothetical protein
MVVNTISNLHSSMPTKAGITADTAADGSILLSLLQLSYARYKKHNCSARCMYKRRTLQAFATGLRASQRRYLHDTALRTLHERMSA